MHAVSIHVMRLEMRVCIKSSPFNFVLYENAGESYLTYFNQEKIKRNGFFVLELNHCFVCWAHCVSSCQVYF